jgi:twinkle protein
MTVDEIREELLRRAEDVVRHLLPQGKRQGNVWLVGSVSGAPGKSLKIHIAGDKVGLWGDWAGSPAVHHKGLIEHKGVRRP